MNDVRSVQRLIDTAMRTPKYSYPMLENAGKPPEPFASVKLLSEWNPGFDTQTTIENDDDTVTVRTVGSRLLTFEVLFTEGQGAASQFTSSFYRQDMYELMNAEVMAILESTPIRNETLTLETNWEIRHGIQLVCLTQRVFEHTTDSITATSISGEVNEGYHVTAVDIEVKNN